MRLSFVIPAFNEEKLLPATLRSLQAGLPALHERGWSTEVIVSDNNSTDATPALAAAGGAKVVFEPVNMIARARNAGAAAATGEWLVFLDADSIPSRELLLATAETIESGGVIAGGSTVRLDGGGLMIHVVTAAWNRVSRFKRWMAGSYIFVRADAFREIGGFSQEHYAGEELHLSCRLHELARREKKQIRILTSAPLLTSARKAHLYRPWELGRFLVRALLRPEATMRDRAACSPWYDGRR